MKIRDLVENKQFDFNVHYRIYRYIPKESEEGLCILNFDSYFDDDIDDNILEEDITAINQSINGIVDIEYI